MDFGRRTRPPLPGDAVANPPDGALPPIAGSEAQIHALVNQPGPVALSRSARTLETIESAFACALHMHQPTIPAGANGELISHLQWMLEHPGQADNHNAEPFARCYRRMADLIPELIGEGCDPRIMLDYSGTLLWGFAQMGREDILAALRQLTGDPALQPHVEWLGTFWGHAVAPSTPIPDLKLQILAWQHQFLALFGAEALQRVKGFSLPEMHLPNHPDTLHALVQALNDCGYRWLLVQEHSVETLAGQELPQAQKFIPNRLVARSSSGATASITALIKTQGSDTKLVGQMQPYSEALGLGRQALGGTPVPSLVCQIADGENGGVMMNEFPQAFRQAHHRIFASGEHPATVALNGSEYLELLEASGVLPAEFPAIQAVGQHRLWQEVGRGATAEAPTPEATVAAIAALQARDPSFSMEGASWTNNLSWVACYANVLEPMNQLSAAFHQEFDPLVAGDPGVTRSPRYQRALLHLLLLETSCFRYWGQGTWTAYAREIHRRGLAAIAGP
ncbi:MAG: glycosyl hydrolase family 57 [Synechococcus sp.]